MAITPYSVLQSIQITGSPDDLEAKIPSEFKTLLNKSNFSAYEGTRFSKKMREECYITVPGILDAEYLLLICIACLKNNVG